MAKKTPAFERGADEAFGTGTRPSAEIMIEKSAMEWRVLPELEEKGNDRDPVLLSKLEANELKIDLNSRLLLELEVKENERGPLLLLELEAKENERVPLLLSQLEAKENERDPLLLFELENDPRD